MALYEPELPTAASTMINQTIIAARKRIMSTIRKAITTKTKHEHFKNKNIYSSLNSIDTLLNPLTL
jgi:hypothetical protein